MTPLTHFDRYATITIQGGGVYGLNLLGQLSELVDEREIIPIALAGNSAGAIIATLYWAGLSPFEIKEKFKDACTPAPGKFHSRLMDMLGPFETRSGGSFDFDKFQEMKRRFEGYFAVLDTQFMGDDVATQAGESKFFNWIRQRCEWFLAMRQFARAAQDVTPHVKNNGVFSGRYFEETIDNWIRDSPKLRKFAGETGKTSLIPPPLGQEGGRLLTFGDFARLQDQEAILFQPLFLTTTNLTLRRLEVIASFDPHYEHWPIARAVRASAGFPVFFRPVAVHGRPVGSWYVDGGLISNFPSWVFGPKFRSSLSDPDPSDYCFFSSFPWLNIGLRVVDEPDTSDRDFGISGPKAQPLPPHPLRPKAFLHSLIGLATGRARNELEDKLSIFVARSRTVLQPVAETGGPESMLAFHQVDSDRVEAMFDHGRKAARIEFANVNYLLPDETATLRAVELIGTLAERAWAILRPFGAEQSALNVFRANVYLPQGSRLCPWCAWNMEGAVDADLEFELGSGLTGFCHSKGRPLLSNLETIAERYRQGDFSAMRFFRMHDIQQQRVALDRTWLASFPIFDPGDIGLHQRPVDPDQAESSFYCEVRSPVQAGGVFGVLNLDGAIDYKSVGLHPEPARSLTDYRMASIIALMQAAAFEVGQLLSSAYPNSAKVRGD